MQAEDSRGQKAVPIVASSCFAFGLFPLLISNLLARLIVMRSAGSKIRVRPELILRRLRFPQMA
jgi:hypothetical protein